MSKHLTATTTAILIVLAGCGGGQPQQAAQPPSGEATLATSGELPPGHPPMGGEPATRPAETRPGPSGPLRVSDVTLTAPEGWASEQPSSSMRAGQYRIEAESGDAEAVVYFFGTGQGGDADSNVERWFSQFTGPDGEVTQQTSREEREIAGVKVTIVEAEGTYLSGMPGGPRTPIGGQALYGVIIESPRGPVFVKVTGPKQTLEAAEAELKQLVKSIRVEA